LVSGFRLITSYPETEMTENDLAERLEKLIADKNIAVATESELFERLKTMIDEPKEKAPTLEAIAMNSYKDVPELAIDDDIMAELNEPGLLDDIGDISLSGYSLSVPTTPVRQTFTGTTVKLQSPTFVDYNGFLDAFAGKPGASGNNEVSNLMEKVKLEVALEAKHSTNVAADNENFHKRVQKLRKGVIATAPELGNAPKAISVSDFRDSEEDVSSLTSSDSSLSSIATSD
jgi:hypothetical protein